MKKIIPLIVISLALFSCQKDDPTVVGTWKAYQLIQYYNLNDGDVVQEYVYNIPDSAEYRFNFMSDGSYEITMESSPMPVLTKVFKKTANATETVQSKGTYTYNASTSTLTIYPESSDIQELKVFELTNSSFIFGIEETETVTDGIVHYKYYYKTKRI